MQPRLVARDCAVAVCVNVRHHDVDVEVLVQTVLRLVPHEYRPVGGLDCVLVHCKPPPRVRRGAVRRGTAKRACLCAEPDDEGPRPRI